MADYTMDRQRLIYLASPYSHHDPEVMEHRYSQAVVTNAILAAEGHLVYSPIAHCHAMAKHYPELISGSWEYWQRLDMKMIHRCDELWVLCIDGWRESVGVAEELRIAKGYGRLIRTVLPLNLENFELSILDGEPQ